MFTINNYTDIIHHLKAISSIYTDNGNEIIIFCPFCDDATRSNNPSHGHCYISKTSPVFICFRCDASGNLRKLLEYTEFKDTKILNNLSEFRESNKKIIKNTYNNIITKYDYVLELCTFRTKYPKEFDIFIKYIQHRIGNVEISKFRITPSIHDNTICCNFYNYFNFNITTRFINNKTKRYKHHGSQYFFQKPEFTNITICEGPFDIINMYLYSKVSGFFIAMCGKKYIATVDNLIQSELLLSDDCSINIIFDRDVKNKQSILKTLDRTCKKYNDNINLKGYLPVISKDVGECVEIEDIRY